MEEKKFYSNIDIKLFIVVSFAIHALLMFSFIPSLSLNKSITNNELKPLKIKIINQQFELKKQIVESLKNKNSVDVKKPRFLGKTNTAFSRQTVSAKVGSFKEAGKGYKDGAKKKLTQKLLKAMKKKQVSFSDLGLAASSVVKKRAKQRVFQRAKGLRNGNKVKRGLSQSNDFVQNIPLGDFTRLNTQEYEFYGFYHRIKQKLEQFWGRNIQEQTEKYYNSGRSIASNKNHITSLVVNINSRGEIVGVNVKTTSGLKELDRAAIDAFNKAGPFPNPPKGMLKNGIAKIEWGFVVNT